MKFYPVLIALILCVSCLQDSVVPQAEVIVSHRVDSPHADSIMCELKTGTLYLYYGNHVTYVTPIWGNICNMVSIV